MYNQYNVTDSEVGFRTISADISQYAVRNIYDDLLERIEAIENKLGMADYSTIHICPNCGAQVQGMKCDYCDTLFEVI